MSAKERQECEKEFKVIVQWDSGTGTMQITILTMALDPVNAVIQVLPRLSSVIQKYVDTIKISTTPEILESPPVPNFLDTLDPSQKGKGQ